MVPEHTSRALTKPPWDDCKVAFGIDDERAIEVLFYSGPTSGAARHAKGLGLPPGWVLNEVDGAGARWVAVFRVAGLPTVEDGRAVKRLLRTIGAIVR